jgi:hypothetical protein
LGKIYNYRKMVQKQIEMVGIRLIFDLLSDLGIGKPRVFKNIQKNDLQKYCLTGLKCYVWPSVGGEGIIVIPESEALRAAYKNNN